MFQVQVRCKKFLKVKWGKILKKSFLFLKLYFKFRRKENLF